MSLKRRTFAATRALDLSLLWQSILYVASFGLGKISQVMAIFVYSYFLTPTDFGFYSVFTSYIWVLAIAISANAHLAIGRYLYEDYVDNTLMMSTVLLWIGAISSVYVIIFLTACLFVDVGWTPITWACLLVVSLGFVADSILMQIAAYRQNARILLLPSAIRAVVSSSSTLAILYLASRPDAMALIIGDAFGAVCVIVALFRTPIRLSFSASLPYLRRVFSYALPLTPYMLALTLLSQFDRVLIAAFIDERAAGLYALSYNFGALPLLAASAITSALTRRFFDDLRAARYGALIRQADYAFAMSALCFAIVIAGGESIAWLLLPNRYADAFPIIPVVAYAGMVFTVFQIWMRVLTFRDRPGLISIIATCGIMFNVGLNVLLIPVAGFAIAAWTTLFAYTAMTAAVVTIVRKTIRDLPVGRLVATLAAGAPPLIFSGSVHVEPTMRQIILLVWFAAFVILLVRPIIRPHANA